MKLQESIRRILREERNNYEMFIIRRFDIIDKILKEELEDQVPCYWKEKYKDNDPEYGLELYWSVVVRAVAERTLEIFPEYYREDVEEEYEIYGELLYNIKRMFNKEIKEYYNNADCIEYGESNDFLLREGMNKEVKWLLRRLEDPDVMDDLDETVKSTTMFTNACGMTEYDFFDEVMENSVHNFINHWEELYEADDFLHIDTFVYYLIDKKYGDYIIGKYQSKIVWCN